MSKLNLNCTTFLIAVFHWVSAEGQTPRTIPSPYLSNAPVNSIRTWDVMAPELNGNNLTISSSLDKARITTQYSDGLGRPLQTVVKQGSMVTGYTAIDMVSAVEYNSFGRETFKYLAFAANATGGNNSINDGQFKLNPFYQQSQFAATQYPSETFFYGQTDFEASPLDGITKSMPVGNSWVGSNRGIKTMNWHNSAGDSVRIWSVTNNGIGVWGTYSSPTNATYNGGLLYKNVTEDEHGKQLIEFTDRDGKLILKKMQLQSSAYDGGTTGKGHAGWLCTYYIYDELDQLRAVIQPKGVELLSSSGWVITTDILNELTFRYEYDERGRIIMKKVPGAADQYFVYDGRDRLIMTQDGNLRIQGKWCVTLYDNNYNSAWKTGQWSNSQSLLTHKNAAYNSISYPFTIEPGSGWELFTEIHYDDYNNLPAGLTNSLSNSGYASHFITAYNVSPDYAQPVTQSLNVRGKVTWTKVKVLGTVNQFISTVKIYDELGRVIQEQSINLTTGLDIMTLQYDFSGKVLRNHLKHQKLGGTAQTYELATRYSYDNLGRLSKVEKNVNNTGFKMISTWEYDALGQLSKKVLGNKKDINGNYTTTPLETMVFDYNIRGWQLGTNRDYIKDLNTTSYFGFELGYDKGNTIIPGTTYAALQYNGNITGTVWKSKGDGEKRKYDFTYDAANRLSSANFTQFNGSFNKTAGIDFGVSKLNYDANGNILGMEQIGLKLNNSSAVDQLKYSYIANSNKLQTIIDTANDYTSKLGDFKYDPATKTSTDYNYDVNGNLTSDANKKISSITYNSLNLPQTITVTGKGNISYTYDAQGNKLKKVTTDNTVSPVRVITTLYIDGIVYENEVLQFITHEEGRIRYIPAIGGSPAKFEYDFFIKDQLGNIRMVLTEQKQQDVYPAVTLEGSFTQDGIPNAVYLEKNYYSIDPANIRDKAFATNITNYQNNNGNPPSNNNPNSQTTANSLKLYQLIASASNGVTGLGITLKVMGGDKIDLYGKSYYFQNASTNYSIPVSSILTGLFGTPFSPASSKGATSSTVSAVSVITGAIASFLADPNRNNDGTSSTPRAYINWILFDDNFRVVNSGFDRVGSANVVKSHSMLNIPVNKNGFIYVYVSNESTVNVFFDNLQVIHTRDHILEETHYYPFGLAMAGISSKAFGKIENKKRYNGIELETDFDLGVYTAKFRELDPQIGKWWQVDPEIESMEMWSPYASNYNNPITYSDPLGNVPKNCDWCKELWKDIKDAAKETGRSIWQGAGSAARTVNTYINPLTPFAELATGKSVESDFTEYKPRAESGGEAVIALMPILRTEAAVIKAEMKAFEKAAVTEVKKSTQVYEVGTADKLANNSVKGDRLDIHHVSQSQPANQLIPGYNKSSAPAIALPAAEHRAIPTLKGANTAGNPRQQLAKDIFDLRKYTNAPNNSLLELIKLNKEIYPSSFKKK